MPDRNMIFHPAFIMHQLILPLMFDIGFSSGIYYVKFRLHFESQLQLFLVAWILVLI